MRELGRAWKMAPRATAVALAALTMLLACSSASTEEPGKTPDPSPDAGSVTTPDAATDDAADARVDAPSPPADSGGETSTPSACSVYPDVAIAYDGDSLARYTAFAVDVYKRASADCRVGALFANYLTNVPIPFDCLAIELQALAGCVDGSGKPIVYGPGSEDVNSDACLPSVVLGLKNATNVSDKDVQIISEHVRAAAVTVGYGPGAATALAGAFLAKKGSVVTSASTGHPSSTCDGGGL